jgi:hypothetical protein
MFRAQIPCYVGQIHQVSPLRYSYQESPMNILVITFLQIFAIYVILLN